MTWRELWRGLGKGEPTAAFLEMALVTGAGAFVMGERDLLAFVCDWPVPILTPKALNEHPDLSRPTM